MGTIESKECVEFVVKEAIILQGVKNAYVGLALFMKTESVSLIVRIENFMIQTKESVFPTALNLLKSGTTTDANVQKDLFVTQSPVLAIPPVVLSKFGKEAFVSAFQGTIKEYFHHPASPYLVHQDTNGIQREDSAGQFVLDRAKSC